MTTPTTFEFAVIRFRDFDATGSAPWTKLCGMQTSGFNETATTNDRYVRDCDNPALVPARQVRVSGKQWDLTGTGLFNVDQIAALQGIVGKKKQYQYIIMDIDGETPEEIGTWAGIGVCTSKNMATTEDNDATDEVAIASHGIWTYTPAA